MYRTTAISFGQTKEAVLYFDHVLPAFLAVDWIGHGGSFTPWPSGVGDDILPKHILTKAGCAQRFAELNNEMFNVLRKHLLDTHPRLRPPQDIAEIERSVNGIENTFATFVHDYGLTDLPIVTAPGQSADDESASTYAVVSLASLSLIDVANTPWDQIIEFRADPAARAKLRRLRLFASDNYAGRGADYVRDDLERRIGDYEDEVKRWGFQTRISTLSMLLSSKALTTAASGSVLAALFGAPAVAVAAAVGGAVIELGRVTLHVAEQRSSLGRRLHENPISYVIEARRALAPDV